MVIELLIKAMVVSGVASFLTPTEQRQLFQNIEIPNTTLSTNASSAHAVGYSPDGSSFFVGGLVPLYCPDECYSPFSLQDKETIVSVAYRDNDEIYLQTNKGVPETSTNPYPIMGTSRILRYVPSTGVVQVFQDDANYGEGIAIDPHTPSRLVVNYQNGTVMGFDVVTGKQTEGINSDDNGDSQTSPAFSPMHTFYANGGVGYVYVADSFSTNGTRLPSPTEVILAVKFSTTGRFLGAGGYGPENGITVWDLSSQKLVSNMGGDEIYYSIAFAFYHPKVGQILAAGTDSQFTLYNVPSGEALTRLPTSEGSNTYLSANPRMNQIVSAAGHKVQMWDLTQYQELLRKITENDFAEEEQNILKRFLGKQELAEQEREYLRILGLNPDK